MEQVSLIMLFQKCWRLTFCRRDYARLYLLATALAVSLSKRFNPIDPEEILASILPSPRR